MNTKINRVLFDYDGTLIIHDKVNEAKNVATILGLGDEYVAEFAKRLSAFFEKCFVLKNRKMTYELYLKNLSKVFRPAEDFGVSVLDLDYAIRENSKVSTVLADGAKETLEYLSQKGYQICLFTNGFYEGQVENMKYKGIYEYFEKIYAWDDFYTKPDIRAFGRALAKTDPKANIMVGDSLTADIAPAKTLGIFTVGINMSGKDMSECRPDVVISNLTELVTIL